MASHAIQPHAEIQPQTDARDLRGADRPRVFGAVLTTRDCIEFIPCKSLNAVYHWLKRHGIVRRGNGSVYKQDVQRELDRMKRRAGRGSHPNSLANLRRSA